MASKRRRRAAGASSASATYLDQSATTAATSLARTIAVDGGVRTGKFVVIIYSRRTSGASSVAPDTLTLNGEGLSLITSDQVNYGNVHSSAWITETDVTTDGTDTIVATWSANSQNYTVASVFALDNLESTTPVDAANAASSPSATLSVNTVSGGAVVAAYFTTTGGHAWSGLTEDADEAFGSYQASSASASGVGVETPRAITVTVHINSASAGISVSLR